jgi:hypothetical protein
MKAKTMANCRKCTHSSPYWDAKKNTSKTICLSPHDKSMVTVEGEHDCQAFKANEWDEERMDVIGSNGNIALHYKEIENGNS